MLPVVATKRGFTGPYVSLTAKGITLPALLVLDKHVKENVAVVFRGECISILDHWFSGINKFSIFV